MAKRRMCTGRYAPEGNAGTGKKGAMPEPVMMFVLEKDLWET